MKRIKLVIVKTGVAGMVDEFCNCLHVIDSLPAARVVSRLSELIEDGYSL